MMSNFEIMHSPIYQFNIATNNKEEQEEPNFNTKSY